jgi:hypothetical protein
MSGRMYMQHARDVFQENFLFLPGTYFFDEMLSLAI